MNQPPVGIALAKQQGYARSLVVFITAGVPRAARV